MIRTIQYGIYVVLLCAIVFVVREEVRGRQLVYKREETKQANIEEVEEKKSIKSQVEVGASTRDEFIAPTASSSSLLFTGDIMLGRYVETLMERNGKEYPFGDTIPFLKSHITIANLEGTVAEEHTHTPNYTFAFSFPSSTPATLLSSGVRAVTLANNHTLDFGIEGYKETKRVLAKAGLASFGANNTTARDYFLTTVGTTTVLIYGINMISSTWDESVAYETTNALRKEYPEALLIAFIHWGNEYDHSQGIVQRAFAHNLVDRGVDVIIGSHPHVVQGIEVYKNAPIFYSLGNFIFDQYFSRDTQEGYMVSVDKNGKDLIFSIVPVVGSHSRTVLATGGERESILSTVASNSEASLRERILQGRLVILGKK